MREEMKVQAVGFSLTSDFRNFKPSDEAEVRAYNAEVRTRKILKLASQKKNTQNKYNRAKWCEEVRQPSNSGKLIPFPALVV